MPEPLQRAPIFLHCGWRTAGTWIWSLFRARPDVMAFYEPLHESLGDMTLSNMPKMRPGATDSRHPEPDRPYFEDFAPLIPARGQGVAGYPAGCAYDQFLIEPQADFPELAAYLDSLIQLAKSNGKTAVLKHCRTLGRVAWMRKHFPDVKHMAVVRSPWGQWLSGWRIYKSSGNAYFVAKPLTLLARYHDHSRFAAAMQALDLTVETLNEALKATTQPKRWGAPRKATPGIYYRAFLAFWVSVTYSTLLNIEDIIDSDRLSDSQSYRRETEQMIQLRSGLEIDLSDAQPLSVLGVATGISDADVNQWHVEAIEALRAFESLDSNVSKAQHYAASAFIREKLDRADMRAALAIYPVESSSSQL